MQCIHSYQKCIHLGTLTVGYFNFLQWLNFAFIVFHRDLCWVHWQDSCEYCFFSNWSSSLRLAYTSMAINHKFRYSFLTNQDWMHKKWPGQIIPKYASAYFKTLLVPIIALLQEIIVKRQNYSELLFGWGAMYKATRLSCRGVCTWA